MLHKKLCSKCKKEKPLTEFPKQTARLSGLSSYCKHCNTVNSREVYYNNRHDAIMAYGGYECVCNHSGKQCGITIPQFLTIDHINGNGATHRRKIGGSGNLYRWLRKNNYPIGFQVLCYNCNIAKGHYGKCPSES